MKLLDELLTDYSIDLLKYSLIEQNDKLKMLRYAEIKNYNKVLTDEVGENIKNNFNKFSKQCMENPINNNITPTNISLIKSIFIRILKGENI